MNQRHMEHFGPDLGRGPFASQRIDTAAIQIATALAQLRAPLSRADEDIIGHGDFIRQLADRLAPDYAAFLAADVGVESGNQIHTTFRTALSACSVIECWLADGIGGGPATTAPASVTFEVGTVLQTVRENKHFRVLTSTAGIATATVLHGTPRRWYWAFTRHGRVFYSYPLDFA